MNVGRSEGYKRFHSENGLELVVGRYVCLGRVCYAESWDVAVELLERFGIRPSEVLWVDDVKPAFLPAGYVGVVFSDRVEQCKEAY